VSPPEGPDAPTLEALIAGRMAALDIGPAGLVARMGYRNHAKGIRRAEALIAGDADLAAKCAPALAEALDVSGDALNAAIAETRRSAHAAQEAARRAAFTPHAVVLTERRVPQPIFVAVMTGSAQRLRIDFPPGLSPAGYAEAARAALPDSLLGFGAVTGFVVNYTPDEAVRFDRGGTPIERLDHTVRRGHVSLSIGGGRKVTSEELFPE
jgi:hypothetical protein